MNFCSSRRPAAQWASPLAPTPPLIDVLIPTAGRTGELAVTLAGLAAQDGPTFRIIVSDQSDDFAASSAPNVEAMIRTLAAQGRDPELHQHLPKRGLAEHRQHLLDLSSAEYVLFLDDDVWLEPGSLEVMFTAIRALGCGFVGTAPQGLSYLHDDRPAERRAFTPWNGQVTPERLRRRSPGYNRWPLHNAANLTHLAAELKLTGASWIPYKVAWIGGCVLYNRDALVRSGGFDFWPAIPTVHYAGEDVAAQWRVMERFGGAGIIPSGAVHLEAPTTIPDRRVNVVDIVFPDHEERS